MDVDFCYRFLGYLHETLNDEMGFKKLPEMVEAKKYMSLNQTKKCYYWGKGVAAIANQSIIMWSSTIFSSTMLSSHGWGLF